MYFLAAHSPTSPPVNIGIVGGHHFASPTMPMFSYMDGDIGGSSHDSAMSGTLYAADDDASLGYSDTSPLLLGTFEASNSISSDTFDISCLTAEQVEAILQVFLEESSSSEYQATVSTSLLSRCNENSFCVDHIWVFPLAFSQPAKPGGSGSRPRKRVYLSHDAVAFLFDTSAWCSDSPGFHTSRTAAHIPRLHQRDAVDGAHLSISILFSFILPCWLSIHTFAHTAFSRSSSRYAVRHHGYRPGQRIRVYEPSPWYVRTQPRLYCTSQKVLPWWYRSSNGSVQCVFARSSPTDSTTRAEISLGHDDGPP